MKHRSFTKLLSCIMAFSVAASTAPVASLAAEVPAISDRGGVQTESLEEPVEILQDGIYDSWNQDAVTVKPDTETNDAVNQLTEDSWLHLKAGTSNGNSAGNSDQYPAMFVNPSTFDFTKAGFFEFTLKSVSEMAKTRFGIYLDYKDPGNGMFFGYDSDGWFWQKYQNGDGDWYSEAREASPEKGAEVPVRVDWNESGKFTLTVNGKEVFKEEASGLTHNANGKIAFKLASRGAEEVSDVMLRGIHYTGQASPETYLVSGRVADEDGKVIAGAEVYINGVKDTTDENGKYAFRVPGKKSYTIEVKASGYITGKIKTEEVSKDVELTEIKLKKITIAETHTLSTDTMDVKVGSYFPYIERYIMKGGSLEGKEFFGQLNEINTIKINGSEIQVKKEDVETVFEDKKAVYTMKLKHETDVDCVITAEITVDKNTASFDITKVVNNLTEKDENDYEVNPVQTIEIPNHSLISVNSSQTAPHLKAAKMSSNTLISGDKDFDLKEDSSISEDFMYGFLNNSEMSAGLWSNSENQGSAVAAYVTAGGASNTRVIANTFELQDGTNALGLSSAAWYYDRKITTEVGENKEERTYVVKHEIMPSAKVVITGDENQDGDIDWQDGAVAYRSIMNNPQGCEVVPNLVNYRIAMNFGSMAANPFLTNLDGVKRVYLNTEGLGQGVLLKGYGSEGHDSGHPDYSDIGKRIGGAEDMKTLLQEGKKMGALFGVHVNCSEMYTEAKAFDDELSRHNYGWNWLDQGIGINGLYDLASGRRENRFKALHEIIGNDLDFIYVDVWGNNTSGAEDAWESRMLAREINSLGWRLATEWGPTQEYDSTLQHWAADLAYGGNAAKGENSEVMRFLRNHQKDSWIADYPSYSGAAQMPLLGGLNMTDFEGWQGRTDYDNYIKVMFRHNLITKYLQHYQIVDWKDGETVSMGSNEWTPEMEITLRNTKDSKDNTEIVVSRDSNDVNDLAKYRSRTIKVNGVTVSAGAPTGGDGTVLGDEKYLIPWNWNAEGKDLKPEDQKLYHWSTNAGQSTWTLTEDWQNLSNVVVYRLTDEGKKDKKVVNVVNNTITLDAEAETPYVIYKGEKADLNVDWQTSKYVYDMGFNDTKADSHRTISGSGTAEIVENVSANHMLKLEGEVSVSTELTNLKAGQKYALYIGVDNRSDSNAYMTVTGADNKTLGTNYTGKSFVYNLVSSDQHNTANGDTIPNGNSYFQNMFVFFTADSDKATLTLKRDSGEGASYFDDIRVVESKMDVVKAVDEDGYISELSNDFEENVQGIWPFVVSGPLYDYYDEEENLIAGYSVTDNRIHLSERHDKYTQAGYGVKVVDDVLDGNWSVKINGLVGNESMIYQTIPQNFHFKAGENYYVTFDYQMGSAGTYEIRLGDGEKNDVKSWKLPAAIGETKRYGISFTASESGNNWIGIYSTGESADTHDLSGGAVDFSGYKDFILDNLSIQKGGMFINTTYTETTTAKNSFPLKVDFANEADKNAKVTWKSSDESVVRVSDTGEVYFVGFGSAMVTASANVGGKDMTLSSAFYMPEQYVKNPTYENIWTNSDSPEPKEGAIDGNPSTLWHSDYAGGVSEQNPAILTVQFKEDITEFETVAFQQRSSFHNGYVQKYECIVGDSFDPDTHQIQGTDGVDRFSTGIVENSSTKGGEIVNLNLPKETKGHYLQIRVLQGKNNFGAVAEILLNTVISYDTPEERGYFKANEAVIQNEKDMPEALKGLNEAINASKGLYDAGQQDYTDETWNAFKAAYEAAKAGVNSNEAAKLRELQNKLETAKKGLVKKSPVKEETIQKGETFKYKKITYKVANAAKKTVTVQKGANVKSVSIPAEVQYKGVSFKVTEINANAFKGFKKLVNVTIGKNVKKIGKQSFYNAKKLKKVVFKSVTAASVQGKAFKGTNAKIKVQFPKKMKAKQKTKLKKALKKAGIRNI